MVREVDRSSDLLSLVSLKRLPKHIAESRSFLLGKITDWRVKALLQRVFSALPGGEQLNYVVQRYVVRSLPVSDSGFAANVVHARRHIDALQRHYKHSVHASTFYEFGAGWDMTIPLAYYTFGIENQIIVDIRNLIRLRLVNDTINKYQRMASELDILRIPSTYLECQKYEFATLFKRYYGIDYRAPCDPKQTGLEAESVDCITSTSTLEHIPLGDIKAILRECHRILSNEGLMSFVIDYLDHYSYFDRRISGFNYLQYSDRTWALLSPALHYQNRLRHRDYLDLLQAAGFEVLEEQRKEGTPTELKIIERLSLAERFRAYSLEDLAVGSALVVARKRAASTEQLH
jgi:Methyltransferase domain